jgi:AraC-like DNA-binding protein
MSTLTPEPWAEIAQDLRAGSVIRHGMILEDMERGMDAEQIASRQRITRDTATSYMREVEARPLRQARHLLDRDQQVDELARELGF